MEHPDRWAVITVTFPSGEVHKRVLCGWIGSYLDADYWRLGSNIVDEKDMTLEYLFTTESGNEYMCRKSAYGFTGLSADIYRKMQSYTEHYTVEIDNTYSI